MAKKGWRCIGLNLGYQLTWAKAYALYEWESMFMEKWICSVYG